MADAADDDDDDTPTEHGNERLSMPGTPDHVSEACELLGSPTQEGGVEGGGEEGAMLLREDVDRMGVELLEGLSQDMVMCRICDRLTATSVLRATWPAESHACRRDMAVCPSGECSYGPCEVCGDPVMSLNLPWDLHRARVCMYCRGR
jgi:hypothetical protein